MTFESCSLTTMKVLAQQSLRSSMLDEQSKAAALARWTAAWEKFIDSLDI